MPAKPIPIPGLTLVCVDCIDVERARLAIERSLEEITPDQVLLLTSLPCSLPYAVTIEPILSIEEYSRFVVMSLHRYIATDLVLIVQHDGWIMNGLAWSEHWREFDYVGGVAPWTEPGPDGKGGNGGFSLRSKRLLQAGGSLVHHVFGCHPEDVFFSGSGQAKRSRRAEFEAMGMKFAPRSVQERFCKEKTDWAGEFGHHKGNLRGRYGEWQPSTDVFQFRDTHLGDQWALLNWAIHESERTQTDMRVSTVVEGIDYRTRLQEILTSLEHAGRVTLTDEPATRYLLAREVWLCPRPYKPTRVRWQAPGHGICYQFDSGHVGPKKCPDEAEAARLIEFLQPYGAVALGRERTLGECIAIAASSRAFVGICGGMSHLAHSVGVPVFLIQYQKPVAGFHLGKQFTLCRGTDDAIAQLARFLEPSTETGQ